MHKRKVNIIFVVRNMQTRNAEQSFKINVANMRTTYKLTHRIMEDYTIPTKTI